MPFYGVQKPARAKLARAVLVDLDGFAAWRDTVLELWHGARFREERYMALAVLGDRRYARFRTLDALPLYEELIVTGAWWDFVDEVAAGPLGDLLPEVAPALREWSVDDDLWKRRASIIAQVRRKRETDFALLTDCIEPNRADREFFIRKAIGWALRAYAWVEPEAVRRLLRHPRAVPAVAPRGAQERHMSAVITLRRMAAYLRAHGVDAWADYIEALPPDGPEARAFERSQAEIGHPDPFRPRTDRGLFMRKQLPDIAPNALPLKVLVALEGLEEPGEPALAPDDPRSPASIVARALGRLE